MSQRQATGNGFNSEVTEGRSRRKSNSGFQSATERIRRGEPDQSTKLPSLVIMSKQGCLLDETGKMPVLRPAESRRDQLFGAAGDDQFLSGGTERREGE